MSDDTATAPTTPAPRAKHEKVTRPWYKRHWLHLVLVLLLGLAIGASAGGDDTALRAAEQRASKAEGEIKAAQADATRAREALQSERTNLDNRKAGLDKQQADLDARKAALDKREKAIGGQERQAAANTVPGDGTFLVGTDIKPGQYRRVGEGDCYWARLSGTSGDFNDILANGNVSGSTVVTIRSSDKAFETKGCGEWKKIR